MDIFVEHMVAKKKTAGSYLRIVGAIIGIVLVLYLIPLAFASFPAFGTIAFMLCVCLIYLLYHLVISTNLEYEYCFTNGSMDVDKIIARRRRKRMADVNARKIEKMASIKDYDFNRFMGDSSIKKIYACSHKDDEGVYYVLFDDEKGKKMLLFNPNDVIKDGFRRYNPRKVFLDD